MIDIFLYLKKNPKQAGILVILSALIILILYLNFLLKPQIMRVSAVFAGMKQTSDDLRKTEEEIGRMPRYVIDIASYEEKISRYEKMLPVEQEIPALLESLSNMARGSNVKIVAITPVMPEEGPNDGSRVYQEMPILINAKSGYHELGNFLAKLEYADRFMKIADIVIRSNNSIPKKQDVDLLILTYILLNSP
ncbi:MAG: type 4a pilus biogenesis protein PilO [Candidatus Omnitrophota bacterium]|nr:type 4a pilus biogenesis protein PilO [Candidatus Omnitrophota bacterium]